MQTAATKGRIVRPDIKLGICQQSAKAKNGWRSPLRAVCGPYGGDPERVRFCLKPRLILKRITAGHPLGPVGEGFGGCFVRIHSTELGEGDAEFAVVPFDLGKESAAGGVVEVEHFEHSDLLADLEGR